MRIDNELTWGEFAVFRIIVLKMCTFIEAFLMRLVEVKTNQVETERPLLGQKDLIPIFYCFYSSSLQQPQLQRGREQNRAEESAMRSFIVRRREC